MFSKKPYDSPPTGYGPPGGDYGYSVRSPPPGSYYVEDVPQHFYKWTSPPGVVRILEATIILLCIAIFACVASTLAWEYGYGYSNGLSGYYGSGLSYGYGYGYGYGSYYSGVTNPRAANGFMIAMSVLCFLTQLGLFVASVSKTSSSRSRRFYLTVIVVCAVLAFVMLIASIVYVMGVNPQAQMTGSYYYSPLLAMCSQMYSSGTYLNQYIYHYCTVDPQEPRAAAGSRAGGWLPGRVRLGVPRAAAGLSTSRSPQVKNVASVQDETATLAYSEKPTSPIQALPYSAPSYGYAPQNGSPDPEAGDQPDRALSASLAEEKGREQPSKPSARRGRRRRRNPELDESQYETDYTTAVESGDERERDRWA
ncbi:OCLN protein, partial [Dromaius novaehollandiae]|nr:OCLN protein [Dromaius novaehollandiae]